MKFPLFLLLLGLAACGGDVSDKTLKQQSAEFVTSENSKDKLSAHSSVLGLSADEILGDLKKAIKSQKTETLENGKVATIYMLDENSVPGFIQVFNPENPERTKFTMIVPADDAVQHKLIAAGLEFLGNTVPSLSKYEDANRWFAQNLDKTMKKGDSAFSSDELDNRRVTIGYAKELNLITLEVEPSAPISKKSAEKKVENRNMAERDNVLNGKTIIKGLEPYIIARDELENKESKVWTYQFDKTTVIGAIQNWGSDVEHIHKSRLVVGLVKDTDTTKITDIITTYGRNVFPEWSDTLPTDRERWLATAIQLATAQKKESSIEFNNRRMVVNFLENSLLVIDVEVM